MNEDPQAPYFTSLGDGRWVVPVSHGMVKNLAAELYTVAEATGMNSAQMKAVKSLLANATYSWFEEALEDAISSRVGSGWRPIRVLDQSGNVTESPYLHWVVDEDRDTIKLFADEGQTGSQICALTRKEDLSGQPRVEMEWTGGAAPFEAGRPEDINYAWNALRMALEQSPYLFDAY